MLFGGAKQVSNSKRTIAMREREMKSSAGTDTTVGASAPRTLNRRVFLGRASLSSVALLLAPEFANGAAFPVAITVLPSPATFAHFQPLAPGHVRPEGWLQLYLSKQPCRMVLNHSVLYDDEGMVRMQRY
jgi:hypothetical protein